MKKHLQHLIIALLIPFSALTPNVFAETTLVEKTTTGYGKDYQEALSSALLDAVRQIRGVQVGTEQQLKIEFQDLVKGNTEISAGTVGVTEDIFTRSNGTIHSYQVTQVKKPADANDLWAVTIAAKIPEFQSVMKDDKRLSIAVMPFRFAHVTFSIDDQGKPSNAYQMSSRIRDRIQTALTQTQQFAVVNRSSGAEFASEKALLSSDNVPPTEASRLGQVVGADFMVVGNIHDLTTEVERLEFYGSQQLKMTDRIDLSYQLIEVATQKILWADTLTQELIRDEDQTTTSTLDHIANAVMSGIMEQLYPIKVIDILSEDEIYLSQGQSRLTAGDLFAVYAQGRNLTDPDTGMPIKTVGQKMAELTVTSVQPKYALARLSDGQLSQVEKGAIVRRLKTARTDAEQLTDIQEAKQVKPTSGSDDAPIKW